MVWSCLSFQAIISRIWTSDNSLRISPSILEIGCIHSYQCPWKWLLLHFLLHLRRIFLFHKVHLPASHQAVRHPTQAALSYSVSCTFQYRMYAVSRFHARAYWPAMTMHREQNATAATLLISCEHLEVQTNRSKNCVYNLCWKDLATIHARTFLV